MAATLRAVVMLTVLVGLPAAWIYYGPLPPGAQRVVDRVIELVKDATGWRQPAEALAETKAAPQFSAVEAAPTFAVSPAPVAPTTPTAVPTGLAEQLEPMLERLRALGPTEYALEPWGSEGQLYRFRCAMPLADDHQVTREFAAVAATPLASVEQVVGEVTNWQSARAGGRQLH